MLDLYKSKGGITIVENLWDHGTNPNLNFGLRLCLA